jgi:hypothetical protein
MNQASIKQQILRAAYNAYFSSSGTIELSAVLPKNDVTADELRLAIQTLLEPTPHSLSQAAELMKVDPFGAMVARGLMSATGLGGADTYKITDLGILYCEEEGLVSKEISTDKNIERLAVLKALISWQDENKDLRIEPRNEHERELFNNIGGPPTSLGVHLDDLCDTMSKASSEILPHILILQSLGYISGIGLNVYLATARGRLMQRYEDLCALSGPRLVQRRGTQFESLIGDIVEQEGWEQEHVTNSNEDIDVMINRDGIFYLIECKWLKNAVGAPVVRILNSKLDSRYGAGGLIFSMSGFTSTVAKTVQDLSNKHQILLFGPHDVEALMSGRASFENLLQDKRKALLTHRRIEVS